MTFKLGSTDINKLYLGSTEIKKAYLGSSLMHDTTGGGGTLWTPVELGTAIYWYKADDDNSITHSSNAVSIWADQTSQVNLTQSNASYKPTYDNTNDLISFDGDYLIFSSSVDLQAGIFVVRNADGSVDSSQITPLVYEYTGDHGVFLRSPTASDYSVSVNADGGETGDVSINGGSLTPGDGSGTDISVTGYVPFPTRDEVDMVYFQLSAAVDFEQVFALQPAFSAAYEANCDCHEIILWKSTPTEANRQKAEGYLAHKWGFTSKLPAGHPYKSSAPTI